MQILYDLFLPWLLLAFWLPAVLAKGTPHCAAPPTEITEYIDEFWVQVVYLKPLSGLTDQIKYNSLYVDRRYDPRFDEHVGETDSGSFESRGEFGVKAAGFFDRLVVATASDTTEVFRLTYSLLRAYGQAAVLWPDALTPNTLDDPSLYKYTSIYNGFSPLGFDIATDSIVIYKPVYFRIVKICTPDNNTELQLRGRVDGGMSFLIIRFFCCSKNRFC